MIKFLKWLFLGLWILCILAFSVGQFLAPPEYHLIPNNPWGNLFGTSVVFGIISFGLSMLLFIVDFFRNKNIGESLIEAVK